MIIWGTVNCYSALHLLCELSYSYSNSNLVCDVYGPAGARSCLFLSSPHKLSEFLFKLDCFRKLITFNLHSASCIFSKINKRRFLNQHWLHTELVDLVTNGATAKINFKRQKNIWNKESGDTSGDCNATSIRISNCVLDSEVFGKFERKRSLCWWRCSF